ncbi:SUR7/PalI family protein [Sporobolomyces koalae]|uniref:SUR7/PalI family protein n=1 Tax=Sporobolomyces koalae TaxID=500713 RepID=UPI00318236D1
METSVWPSVKSHLKLGVFGYCFNVIGKRNFCSPSELGYELPSILAILGRVTGLADEHAQDTIRSVTKAFVLHPIACGISFGAFVVSALPGRTAHIAALAAIVLTFLLALVCVILDIVFFHVAKKHIEDESDRLTVEVAYSAGTWVCVVASLSASAE